MIPHSEPGDSRRGPAEIPQLRRYVVSGELGAGSAGVVYRAHDRERGVDVALKVLHRLDPDQLLRFKNEFRALVDLRHPNLVRLGELCEEEGTWYFTMELVDGQTFLSHVRPEGHLDEPRLRATLIQLVQGVEALHEAQLIHRDLKPSNVLVTPAGRVVVLDLGLVARLEQGRQHSDVVFAGTLGYMAPELCASLPLTPAADWYSAGVMLYEALADQLPFDGTALELLARRVDQEAPPPAPRAIDPSVPEDLDALCLELLRPDPRTRPRAEEILARLETATPPRPSAVPEQRRGRSPADSSPPRRPSQLPSRLAADGGQLDARLPFTGRRRELAQLGRALAESHRGPVIQLISGDSGIGKSALAHAFGRGVRELDPSAVVLAARCHERESLPFKAFDAIADRLARHLGKLGPDADVLLPRRPGLLAHLFPVFRRIDAIAAAATGPRSHPDDPRELRQQAFAAFRELLTRMAERAPLVLIIDDLPWADHDSIDLLAHLLQPPEAPHLLILATARGADPVLELPTGLPAMQPLPLAALDPTSTRELARLVLGAATVLSGEADRARPPPAPGETGAELEEDAERIAAASCGHPGFLLELARAQAQDRRAGESLDELLWSRVAALDSPSRLLVKLLSVAGGPLTTGQLANAAGLGRSDLLTRLDSLRDQDLITTAPGSARDRVVVHHNRLVVAVHDRLTPELLRHTHKLVATALESERDPDPEQLMFHWRQAGRLGRATEYAVAAADRAAASLEFRRAARLYRIALGDDLPERSRGSVLARLAAVLADAGSRREAAAAYLDASRLATATSALELRRAAAEQFLLGGHVDDGLDVLDGVLESLGVRPATAPLLGRLLAMLPFRGGAVRSNRTAALGVQDPLAMARLDACWLAAMSLSTIDPARGARYQAHALVHARGLGPSPSLARGLAIEAAYASTGGEAWASRAAALLAEASAVAGDTPAPATQGWLALAGAMTTFLAGHFAASRSAADEAIAWFSGQGRSAVWELRSARQFALSARYFCGDLGSLSVAVRRALHDALTGGDTPAAAQLRLGTSAAMPLLADDPAACHAGIDAALAERSLGSRPLPRYHALSARAQAYLYQGDGARAHQTVESGWGALESSQLLRIAWVRIDALFLRGRAALAAAALRPATGRAALIALVRRCARQLAHYRDAWAGPLALMLEGAAACSDGNPERARARFEQAAQDAAGCDLRMHAAVASHRLGALLGGNAGVQLCGEAVAWLRSERVARPERWIATLLPLP